MIIESPRVDDSLPCAGKYRIKGEKGHKMFVVRGPLINRSGLLFEAVGAEEGSPWIDPESEPSGETTVNQALGGPAADA